MRTLTQVDITGLRVLLRVDYNVPLDKNGEIADDFKIKKSLQTLRYILKRAKQVIIISHFGRPEGSFNPRLTMDGVAIRLMKLLGKNIVKLDDCIDVGVPENKVILLENLRFHKGEKENNELFAKKLSSHADIFVNDAFSVCHRNHASVTGITKFLPSCAGFLVQKEVENLNFKNAKKPFMIIMGGSKLSTKFPVINSLISKADKVLLGGAMIFTFFKASGKNVGKSLYEEKLMVAAKLLINNEKLLLPKDIVCAPNLKSSKLKVVSPDNIAKNLIGLDVGEESLKEFKKVLKEAKTVFWNGPLGYYEIESFSKSTYEMAKFLSELSAKVIIGGGDSAAVVHKLGLVDKFFHVSAGGGSSLEFIKDGTLPGLEVLKH
ncbi:phosphoglycerate kinase [Candidatus Woesearchaeota archaeon]|jgi:phosphoglycerate kinase|nr:phosphoglycerate kinase [Candidatus Woesearchaeota archaeon]